MWTAFKTYSVYMQLLKVFYGWSDCVVVRIKVMSPDVVAAHLSQFDSIIHINRTICSCLAQTVVKLVRR